MGEIFGIATELVLAIGGALLLVVGGGIALAARSRRQIPSEQPPSLEDGHGASAPTRDVLEDRKTLDAPVEIDDSMSLREIRELKRAKLKTEYKTGDASRAAKDWRKGAQDESQGAAYGAAETQRVPVQERREEAEVLTAAAREAEEAKTAELPADEMREAAAKSAEPAFDGEPTEKAEVPEPSPAPSKTARTSDEAPPEPAAAIPANATPSEEQPKSLEAGLAKTRTGFLGRIADVFAGKKQLDDDIVEQVEEVLFTADIGAKVSQQLLMAIEDRLAGADTSDPAVVWAVLREEAEKILAKNEGSYAVTADVKPFVTLVVGVNGAGKTTTIGKLAAKHQRNGLKVLMVAGDTFRAAAVEQLEEWSERVGCGFHRGEPEADPSAVIFDGIELAKNEGYDVVLCDTAGRLHTRAPLVDELKKIHRVAGKAEEGAPHETLLVLDANTGQNAIQQAKLFGEAVDITGIVLTKLDGTAKGGVILGICNDLGVPVYFIGIGEGIRDLRPFDSEEFVDALFA